MLLTNLCRLFLISLSSHQHLQTVVWSIPGKIWGRDGRCTVPQPPSVRDRPRVCPLPTSALLCTAQERAAGSFDMLQALSQHPGTVQQARDTVQHHQALCSPFPGSWGTGSARLLLIQAVLLCSGRANAEKASCSLWHCGHSLPLLLLQGELPGTACSPPCSRLHWHQVFVSLHTSLLGLSVHLTQFLFLPISEVQDSHVPRGTRAETRARCGAYFAHGLDSNSR